MFLFNLICSFAPHFLVCSSQDQRQQYCLASKILLPPPKTRRNSPRPKAAILSHKQDFAASAEDPMKLTKVKGSKLASEARFCCLRRRPEETRQDQRQQPCLQKQDFAAPQQFPEQIKKAGAPRRPLLVYCIKFSQLRNSE